MPSLTAIFPAHMTPVDSRYWGKLLNEFLTIQQITNAFSDRNLSTITSIDLWDESVHVQVDFEPVFGSLLTLRIGLFKAPKIHTC